MPKASQKGIKQDTPVTWKGALHDINVDLEAGQWGIGSQQGAEEVDSLTFCCCESCHGSYSLQDVSNAIDVRGIPTVRHGEPIFYTSHVQGVSLGSLSNSVFERRTSTGSGRFASLGGGLVETLR